MLKIQKYLPEIILGTFAIFLLVAISPPFAYKLGFPEIGDGVHSLYRIFCHQRVERTPFFFGEDSFIQLYTIEELQENGDLPQSNPKYEGRLSNEIYGYPYVGNEYIGYKVALCMRDIGMYLGILCIGIPYLIFVRKNKKIVKFPAWIIIALVLPMMLDGVFQVIAEISQWDWVPESYFANNTKRIVTGFLFGSGFVIFIMNMLLGMDYEGINIKFRKRNEKA